MLFGKYLGLCLSATDKVVRNVFAYNLELNIIQVYLPHLCLHFFIVYIRYFYYE